MTEKEKEERIDIYDLPVHDCALEQNSSPYFSSIVRQCKWLSLSRKMIEIHKYCYHGNLTSLFCSLYSIPYYRKLTLHEIKVLEINAT